jgi:hypothetical protein
MGSRPPRRPRTSRKEKPMGRPLNQRFFDTEGGVIGEEIAGITVTAGGSYTTAPTVSVSAAELPGGVDATLGAIHFGAVSATVDTSGVGTVSEDYEPGDELTVSGGTGTAPVFVVDSVRVRTAANVADAGGFADGDTVTFSTGWDTPAVLTLSVDGGGAITGVVITNPGVFSGVLPSDPVTPDSTSGGGTLAGTTFNLGFGVNAVSLVTAGDLTVLPANPAATTTDSATGTGATLVVTYEVSSVDLTDGGSGYVSPVITFSAGAATAVANLTVTGDPVLLPYAVTIAAGNILAADIVKQTGTNKYVMLTDEGSRVCTLVANDTPTVGQAYLIATDSANNTYWVTKLTARKAVLQQRAGGTWLFPNGYSAPWLFEPAAGAVVSIDSI